MVKKFEKHRQHFTNHIKADVIILGCSLPGIVTAHNLKKKFGDSMDIVVLNLPGRSCAHTKRQSRCNVAFEGDDESEEDSEMEESESHTPMFTDTVARFYLTKYAKDFNLSVPDLILSPLKCKNNLSKLFQYRNGSIVECKQNYHDFDFLNFLERFELEQYQSQLDSSMHDLFKTCVANTAAEKKKLLYYDQTTMEEHICGALLFSTPREVMRTIVRLVCGATAENVSLLFYLHQCYRTNSSRNHLDGDNTRFREKLLGSCRKQFSNRLFRSIADITLTTHKITNIRTCADELVVLEPSIGETDYVCNLVAMAIGPDQLDDIEVETQLLPKTKFDIISHMTEGSARKFVVSYKKNFWRKEGYSGDILSIRGPIAWAMERPRLNVAHMNDPATLIGYLKVKDDVVDSRDAVLDQLVELFGDEAAEPINYHESRIRDIFIPRCGDYIALRDMAKETSPKFLEWGALDLFTDGDMAASIEAGHTAYLHLLSCLRPQAVTYEDVTGGEAQMNAPYNPFDSITASINIINTSRLLIYGMVIAVGMHLIRNYILK